MRIVFYECGYETFGVQYLISVLKEAGHDVFLSFDSSFSKDYLAQDFFLTDFFSLTLQQACDDILSYSPEAACFSIYTMFYQENIKLIRLLKKSRPDLIIICGGFHTSLLPELVIKNKEIDFAVIGESEFSLPALLEAVNKFGMDKVKTFAREELPGVWNMYNGSVINRGLSLVPQDLDAIPFPEKEMYYRFNPSLSRVYNVVTSRGCPGGCTYCSSATMNKLFRSYNENYYRVRSVENVIQELKAAVTRHKPRYVMFFDSLFAARRNWLKEFSLRYKKEINLPYYCQTSPLIHDAESLKLLAESGCCLVEFGFQTANDTVRREILNRRETREEMRGLLLKAKTKGMFTELDLIVNLPGETPEHILENLAFISETRPHWVNLAYLMFFPKTVMTEIALHQGVLSNEDVSCIEEGKYAFNMRLLSNTGLGKQYRILPFQVFLAFYLPNKVSSLLISLIEKPIISDLCSRLASFFIYLSRILLSYTDKRDFFIRHHVIRSFYAARQVLKRKVFKPCRIMSR